MRADGRAHAIVLGRQDDGKQYLLGIFSASQIARQLGVQIHTYEVITEQFDANLESILHFSRSKPEMVARLVKSWIVEDTSRK